MKIVLKDFGKLKALPEHIDAYVTKALYRVGEEGAKAARLHRGYMDDTGNLHSSVNYGVFKDGRELMIGEPETYKNGEEGARVAAERVREVGSHTHGYAVVLVAGMEYASFVENIHGKDVLAGGVLKAEEVAERLFKGLKE